MSDMRDDKREMSYNRGAMKNSDKQFKSKQKVFFKRKVCRFCTKKINIDFKDADLLRKFTTERGKIMPRRILGTCAKHQRKLNLAIKRARVLALLPFVEKFK